MKERESNKLFPVFVKIENLNVLIVGGGNVALEKASAILRNAPQARLEIVAGHIREEFGKLAATHPEIRLTNRDYRPTDLPGRDLIFVAVNNLEVSHSIRRQARELGILVNVADTPDQCDFYLGSIVQKGNLKLAISTNGKSPTLAKRLREFFEQEIPDEVDELLTNLEQFRSTLTGDFSDKVRAMNKLTAPLVAGKLGRLNWNWRAIAWASWALMIALILFWVLSSGD